MEESFLQRIFIKETNITKFKLNWIILIKFLHRPSFKGMHSYNIEVADKPFLALFTARKLDATESNDTWLDPFTKKVPHNNAAQRKCIKALLE